MPVRPASAVRDVQMTNDRQELRDEVEWQEHIADGKPQKQPGQPGRPLVA